MKKVEGTKHFYVPLSIEWAEMIEMRTVGVKLEVFRVAADDSLETVVKELNIYDDTIERVVHWKTGPDISRLAGKPIRLRFVMIDADLYSIRFR